MALAPLIIVLAAAVGLLLHQRADRFRLIGFARSIAPSPSSKREIVFAATSRIHGLPSRPDPVFLPTLFEAMGATPSAVIESGGCCSGKSRLLILTLAELGIRSYQITLYHQEGHAQHCLVETCLGKDRLIVDPSYGIYFAAPDGGNLSLRDLQAGVLPVQVPLVSDRRCGYPDDPYYAFDYPASKTANWTCSSIRRVVYRLLHLASKGGVDRLKVPATLEWPQHIFIALAASLGLLAALVLAALKM